MYLGCPCHLLPGTTPGLAVFWVNQHAPKQFLGTVQDVGWVRDLYQTCLQSRSWMLHLQAGLCLFWPQCRRTEWSTFSLLADIYFQRPNRGTTRQSLLFPLPWADSFRAGVSIFSALWKTPWNLWEALAPDSPPQQSAWQLDFLDVLQPDTEIQDLGSNTGSRSLVGRVILKVSVL